MSLGYLSEDLIIEFYLYVSKKILCWNIFAIILSMLLKDQKGVYFSLRLKKKRILLKSYL